MRTSDIFYKQAKGIIQSGTVEGPALVAALRDCFLRFTSIIPRDLQLEFFQHYYDKFLDQEEESPYKLAEGLRDIIDFFKMDDLDKDFSDEEWTLILNTLNILAQDEKVEIMHVQTLLSVAISKGKI